MLLSMITIVIGLLLLLWSADRFIEGAASIAKYLGMSSLLIGMIVVGFGTSAPEMVVSAMAAANDNPKLALGNVLGSNIVNIGLILGITAVIAPITVNSSIVRKELPLLFFIGLLFGWMLFGGTLSRIEALVLLLGFFSLIIWTVVSARRNTGDQFGSEVEAELQVRQMPKQQAVFWMCVGLIFLIISSRLLVWGATNIAVALGVSDLIIGLTIVAFGTSLPELAASIIAARKGEHDIAIGNVVGSNMFNILAVAGIAGVISPMTDLPQEIIQRDWVVMMAMTTALFFAAFGFFGQGKINRLEGMALIFFFVAYTAWLISVS